MATYCEKFYTHTMIINASIQVIPLASKKETSYGFVDKVIEMIQGSELKSIIGAFETTIEGDYHVVQKLLKDIQDFCYSQKQVEFLIYSKLHCCGDKDIKLEQKRLDR